jgi:hypothetical protein
MVSAIVVLVFWFCCEPVPGTKGSCVVAGWQCLQFHWLQALWPHSLCPHSGQSLLQSMLITFLSICLLPEDIICRINSWQLQRNTPCAFHCCLLLSLLFICIVPTAFWWSIHVHFFVVVDLVADMATRRLGPCAESAAIVDRPCIEFHV